MPDNAADRMIRDEWRELGFFYECDDLSKTWRLVGSRAGLLRFRDALLSYVAEPRNAAKSEHEHYGPYMYLTVTTWDEPGVDGRSIFGSLPDLARLAALIESKLTPARPGTSVRILHEFAADEAYAVILEVKEDGFDPATADPQLPAEDPIGHRGE
jgi:hypothetical protein